MTTAAATAVARPWMEGATAAAQNHFLNHQQAAERGEGGGFQRAGLGAGAPSTRQRGRMMGSEQAGPSFLPSFLHPLRDEKLTLMLPPPSPPSQPASAATTTAMQER